MNDSVTVLHLSDPQFGRHHRFGRPDEEFDTLYRRLEEDLRGLEERHGLVPDLLILTGDLAEWGRKQEFDDATRFLDELTGFLRLDRRRVVLVPGNHDVHRPSCKLHFAQCEADEIQPQAPYWLKWRHFSSTFHAFYRDLGLEFSEPEPWSLFEIPDLRVVVAGLNSTMAESHLEEDHYGFVGEPQLDWFRKRLAPYRDRGWLRIAAVHHNVVRGAFDDEENLRDEKDLKRVLGPYLNLVLHGHTHEADLSWLHHNVPILSTGSTALEHGARPEEVPNQYQVSGSTPAGSNAGAASTPRTRSGGSPIRASPPRATKATPRTTSDSMRWARRFDRAWKPTPPRPGRPCARTTFPTPSRRASPSAGVTITSPASRESAACGARTTPRSVVSASTRPGSNT